MSILTRTPGLRLAFLLIVLAGVGLFFGLSRAEKPNKTSAPTEEEDQSTSAQRNIADEKAAPPLVTRNRVQLNLAGAEVILAATRAKAQATKVRLNVYVVDDGGHPIAFARMDGARPGSAYTALTKAVTAATMRAATGPLPNTKNPDLLLNLSLQNAASAGGKFTSLHGGVPVVVDDQVIGAVGCGGGTGEQDAEAARAGIQALLEQLKKAK
jgi:glc operon protein GlcG